MGSFVAASGLVSHGSSGRASWSRTSALHCVALLALGKKYYILSGGVGSLPREAYGLPYSVFHSREAVR